MVAVCGAELSTLALGSALDSGAPLVMLHGLIAGNMASWYSAYATPLARSRRVLLYDQRGHGGSSLPSRGFDLDTQADDLQAVLEHHGADAAVDLVGHSMGALVALHFALRHPLRLRRLVLVDAPMPAREHIVPSLLAARSPDALAAYVDSLLPAGSPDRPGSAGGQGGRRRERLHRRLTALLLESTLIDDLQQMGPEPEVALRALQLPVLLVYGRQSPCLAAGHRLLGLLPQARLSLLDCGHYIPEEAPAALRAELEGFLATDCSSSAPA